MHDKIRLAQGADGGVDGRGGIGRRPGDEHRVLRIPGNGAQVAAAGIPVGRRLADVYLVAAEGQKVRSVQILVPLENIVVGEGDDGIPAGLVETLHLRGGKPPVGKGAVGVQVGFEKAAFMGNEILLHT